MCPTGEQLGITLMNSETPWLHGKLSGLTLNNEGKKQFANEYGFEVDDSALTGVKLGVAKVEDEIAVLAIVTSQGNPYALAISLLKDDWLERK